MEIMSESRFFELFGVKKTGQGIEFEQTIQDEEFQEYYKTLNSNPYYTKLTDEQRQQFDDFSQPILKMSLTYAKKHPFLWGKWVCGINPYDYQFKMLDDASKKRFFICNTARQIGKSLVIGIFSFWAAYNNVFPVGVDKSTKVGIVSATEDQSKKLLKDIYMIIQLADAVMSRLTRGTQFSSRKYFSDKMIDKPTAYKIKFERGSIECFPPTKKVRGNSLSFLIIDEGDFLGADDPEYFFNSEALPTLKKTDGHCLIFSTPSGRKSYYRGLFKPEEESPATGWSRLWFNWTIFQDDWANGWKRYKQAMENGTVQDFEAEYEAKFTSGRHTFLNSIKIDNCINNRGAIFECNEPVYAGVDFSAGGVCRTAVTFSYYDHLKEKPVVLQSKEFVQGYDNSKLVDYFNTWKNRYRLHSVVCEKCPASETPIALLKKAGFRVIEFNSRAEKISSYMNFEIAINNENIELYQDKALISQLKALEAEETRLGNIQIHKPNGMLDDVADSCLFSVSEMIKPKKHGKRIVL